MLVTLPVLMALSSAVALPTAATAAPAPADATQQPVHPTAAGETITCPLNGEQIPACCCPIKH